MGLTLCTVFALYKAKQTQMQLHLNKLSFQLKYNQLFSFEGLMCTTKNMTTELRNTSGLSLAYAQFGELSGCAVSGGGSDEYADAGADTSAASARTAAGSLRAAVPTATPS